MADDDSDNQSASSNEDSSKANSSDEEVVSCVRLPLPLHISAYLEKKELLRETEALTCDGRLLAKITDNYVIVQSILSNLSWQDKLLCKNVCKTWRSAIKGLEREELAPVDFVVDFNNYELMKSSNFGTEPLVVFTFANLVGLSIASECTEQLMERAKRGQKKRPLTSNISDFPLRCTPPCYQNHCAIDMVKCYVCGPKHCMFTVKSGYLSYLPLRESKTFKYTMHYNMFKKPDPFIGGLFIPVLPDVKFHVINIKSNTNIAQDFCSKVREIAVDRIFKGVLIYVTETFLLHSVEEFYYLSYFKEIQPDIPYALGGCIVEDAMYGPNDISHIFDGANTNNDFVSENLISIGMFTVPKNRPPTEQGDKSNFDMYSLVIESSDKSKARIQKTITEFSDKVPRFEHSIVLKLSCVGRDYRHDLEQKFFREKFPTTKLIGCFGNGELGVNHPPRPTTEEIPCPLKRRCVTQGQQSDIVYSYSTIFVYIGWGKITSIKGPVSN